MARNKPPRADEQTDVAREQTDVAREQTDEAPAGGAPAGLGLDDAELSERAHGDDAPALNPEPRTLNPARGRQGDEGRPFCERHNVLMVTYTSKPDVTHYRCPVEGCDARAKRIRPTIKIPATPLFCQQRTCKERGVALEVDPKFSTGAQLHMRCPNCEFGLKVPRPQFATQLARQRREAVDDLAER